MSKLSTNLVGLMRFEFYAPPSDMASYAVMAKVEKEDMEAELVKYKVL